MIVTGMIFSGCAGVKQDVATDTEEVTDVPTDEPADEPADENLPTLIEEATDDEIVEEEKNAESSTVYADGSYASSGSYQTPAGAESISVTLVVKDDKVSSLSVAANSSNSTGKTFQGKFIAGINSLVVGKNIGELGSFSQVNGSSLTPNGFNKALNSIKSQAIN